MSNIYRVIYTTTKGPQPHQVVIVTATTQANAIAAVLAADGKYTDVVSVTQEPGTVLSGS